MPIYRDSRYLSATHLRYSTTQIDPRTGEESVISSEEYLDDDRKKWAKGDFSDDELQIAIPYEGETVDQLAYRLYRRSDFAWVIGEFNDVAGFDMFITFSGTERLTVPSLSALQIKIMANDQF